MRAGILLAHTASSLPAHDRACSRGGARGINCHSLAAAVLHRLKTSTGDACFLCTPADGGGARGATVSQCYSRSRTHLRKAESSLSSAKKGRSAGCRSKIAWVKAPKCNDDTQVCAYRMIDINRRDAQNSKELHLCAQRARNPTCSQLIVVCLIQRHRWWRR